MSEDAYQEFRSAPKLLLLLLLKDPRSRHQEETRTPRQDKAETHLLACLLACLDGSCSDGSCLEAMLGLDRKIQFRIVKKHPKV
jgi:hypothetical protein